MQLPDLTGGTIYTQEDMATIAKSIEAIKKAIEYANNNKQVVHMLRGTNIAILLADADKAMAELLETLNLEENL